MRVIKGYRQGQSGGACLVMIDDTVLPMPELARSEARHSPDGYQWGYGGSGPAELARAILVALYPGDAVVRHPVCYQAFKSDVIARIREDGFTLTSDEVGAWYERWQRSDRGQRLFERIEAERIEAEAEGGAGL